MEYRFREIRKSLDLKQHEVAERTNTSKGAYANIEAETANTKLRYLLTYCNTFNLSMNYICNLTNINDNSYLWKMDTIDRSVMANRLPIFKQENNKQAQDIAKELGILKSTYSGYKNPKQPNLMQTLMLKKLALKYNYSMDWSIVRSNKKNINQSLKGSFFIREKESTLYVNLSTFLFNYTVSLLVYHKFSRYIKRFFFRSICFKIYFLNYSIFSRR